jgi:hypothetical protein
VSPAASVKTAAAVKTASIKEAASAVKTTPSMKTASSMKAAAEAAARSYVDMIHMMEVMKPIDENERGAEAERHGWPIKPRVVIGIVRIRGRRGNVTRIDVRVLLLDLPGAVWLLARKARYVLRGAIDIRGAVDHAARG